MIHIDFGGTLRASTYLNYFIGRQGFNLRSLMVTIVDGRMVMCEGDRSIWLPAPLVAYLLNTYMNAESSTGSDANLCRLFTTLLSMGRLKDNVNEWYSNMKLFNGLELTRDDIENSEYLNISNALIMHLIGCAQILTYPGNVRRDFSRADFSNQPIIESTVFGTSGVGGVSFWPDADLVRIVDSGIKVPDVSNY